MYKIEKRFTFPIGHRLSKHSGKCFSAHGHNIVLLVGVKAETLNNNDMVIDFADLKAAVKNIIDDLDHCMILNKSDSDLAEKFTEMGMRVKTAPFDPTAERLSQTIYEILEKTFEGKLIMDYVTVYENEDSKATYCEGCFHK